MKSKTALLCRARRMAVQAWPCPSQRPPRPRPPPKPRRWRPTPMAVDYPPLPDRMEVDQESWGAPSPVVPTSMDWEPSTPVQQGSSSSPEAIFKRPLPPLTSGHKRRSAPSPPASPAGRERPIKRLARSQSDSPIVPTVSERQMADVVHVSAASPEAAYSPSPCAPLVPAPAPEPAAQGDTPPPPRSRSATMSPDEYEAHEDREAIEARPLVDVQLFAALDDVVDEPAAPTLNLEDMDEEEFTRTLHQAQMEGDLQEVDTLFGRLLNSNRNVDDFLGGAGAP